MTEQEQDDAAKRDAVLRRMLATPKPGKGEKKGGGPKANAPKRPSAKRQPAKAGA